MLKRQLKQHVSAGKLKAAINLLLASTEGDLHSEATHLSGRFANYMASKNRGTLSTSDANLMRNQITQSLLALIEQLPEEEGDRTLPKPAKTTSSTIIQDSKNVISGSTIQVQGDMHIGDNNNTSQSAANKRAKRLPLPTLLALIGVVIAAIVLLFGNNIIGKISGDNAATNTPHTLTIKVRDAENKRPLRNEGTLVLDYENTTTPRQINEQGNVDVRGIASDIGKPLNIQIEAKGYQAVYPDSSYHITEDAITYLVETSCDACRVFGTVRRQDQFVAGAVVEISALQIADTTDAKGFFELQIPPEQEQEEYTLTVLQNNKIVWENFLSPAPNVATEILLQN